MRNLISMLAISGMLALSTFSANAAKVEFDFLMLESEIDVLEFDTNALQIKYIKSVSPNLDIEGVFAIGISDDGYTVSDGFTTVSVDAELENMFGVFLKLHSGNDQGGPQFFGRVGFARMSIEFTASIDDPSLAVSGSDSESDTGIAFGAGVAFGASDSGAITIEYSKLPDVDFLDIDDVETSAISIGYIIEF